MPLILPINLCHVATFHTAPPSHIKFGTKPQASQTIQEKKLFTFYGLHDTSLTTTEPEGQLMGMTKSHYPDEINTSDEVNLDDKRVITDEEKKIIQWRQQITWTVTKPTKQTVGA